MAYLFCRVIMAAANANMLVTPSPAGAARDYDCDKVYGGGT